MDYCHCDLGTSLDKKLFPRNFRWMGSAIMPNEVLNNVKEHFMPLIMESFHYIYSQPMENTFDFVLLIERTELIFPTMVQ